LKVTRRFGEICRLQFEGPRINKKRTSVKAVGKQSNRFPEISDYTENRREMKDSLELQEARNGALVPAHKKEG
jgi:hypothetical protein